MKTLAYNRHGCGCMIKLYIKQFSFLFTSILSFIVGFYIIYKNTDLYQVVLILLNILIFIRGITFLFHRKTFWKGIFNVCIAFFFNFFPNIPLSFLPIFTSLYLLLLSLTQMMTYVFYVKNDEKPRLYVFMNALFLMFLSWPLLLTPLISLKHMLIIIGMYVFIFGIFNFIDFLEETLPKTAKNKIKRKMRVSLPVFVTTFVPYTIYRNINHYLDEENNIKKQNQDFDMEVLIHVSSNGSGTVGHIDLYYKDQIWSFGNYDMKSRHLKEALGDGVLFIAPNKEDYIKFCEEHGKKILFGFGLKLNDAQKKEVDKELEYIMRNTEEWIPYYKRALLNHEDIKDYKDYVSSLYKATPAKFYKFTKGKFKTFFIFSTNCVRFVDTVLGKTGLDNINISGFISPGSYYDYLLREYYKKNSMVVSYHIYKK